jgi:hypothetical protein
MPEGMEVSAGQGLLEVVTEGRHVIYVDGDFVGRGPRRLVPLPAGRHAIRISLGGKDEQYSITVQEGARVRLPLAGSGK